MAFTTFIQWKNTTVCMDFNCPACGEHSHFDGMFAYHIRCPHCQATWRMPSDVPVERAEATDLPVLCATPEEY